jgi:small GTP-binding protein
MESDYIFKTVIIGNTGVGKSCLLQKYTRDQFISYHETTIGVDFATKQLKIPLNGHLYNIKLQLWDTAGQEKFRSITQTYYRNCCAAIVVFDLTNRESFEKSQYWIDTIINGCGNDTTIILVGNKSDLEDDRVITEDEINEFSRQYNIKYFITSAKELDTTSIAFNILAQDVLFKIIQNPNSDLPGIRNIRRELRRDTISLSNSRKKTRKLPCCKS